MNLPASTHIVALTCGRCAMATTTAAINRCEYCWLTVIDYLDTQDEAFGRCMVNRTAPCPPQTYPCQQSTTCVDLSDLCNARRDCPNGDDEVLMNYPKFPHPASRARVH
jgi:hypothetical protein